MRKIPLLLLSSENIQEVWILKESDFGAKKPGVKYRIYIHQGIAFILSSEGKRGKIPRVPIELATSRFKIGFGIKSILIYQQ